MANALVRGVLFAAGLAAGLCAPGAQAGGETGSVIEGSEAARLESCVEPTDFMRRNHMEVIKHQRDETVHNGIRSTEYSLAGCIECHVSRGADNQPIPVNAEGQFCSNCHQFAAVGVDCFGCHATVPTFPDTVAAGDAARGDSDGHPSSVISIKGTQGLEPANSAEGKRP